MDDRLAARRTIDLPDGPVTNADPRLTDVLDALWLGTLHRICTRAAHDVKGALNGVAVNLEVVRSRSEKPDVPAAAVHQYATRAASQFNAVIAMSEALLGLSRLAPEPVEIARVVRSVGALLAPVSNSGGPPLELSGSFDEIGTTTAPASAVRAAIGGCLLPAFETREHVRCVADTGDGNPRRTSIRVETPDGVPGAVDGELMAAVERAGIRIRVEPGAVVISFPR